MFSRTGNEERDQSPGVKPPTSQKWVFARQWLVGQTRTIAQGTAEDDDHVMCLVELVLARPPAERESYLRAACAGDNQLFDEVWKYVEWEDRMNGFLLRPLFAPASNELAFETGEILENRFRIVREVAQGGMGIVYEAMDEKLGRRIAIKCAKPGFAASCRRRYGTRAKLPIRASAKSSRFTR